MAIRPKQCCLGHDMRSYDCCHIFVKTSRDNRFHLLQILIYIKPKLKNRMLVLPQSRIESEMIFAAGAPAFGAYVSGSSSLSLAVS